MEKSSLFNNKGLFATQQITLLPVISIKMSVYTRKENWSPNSCDLNLLDMQFGTSKGFQQQYQICGIDWQKNSSIIQSTNGGCDSKKCTSYLTTPTHDSTYISVVVDVIDKKKIEYDNMIVIPKVSNMRF